MLRNYSNLLEEEDFGNAKTPRTKTPNKPYDDHRVRICGPWVP